MIFDKKNYPFLAEVGRLTIDEMVFVPEPLYDDELLNEIYQEQIEIKKELGNFSILLTENIDYFTLNYFTNAVGKNFLIPISKKKLGKIGNEMIKDVFKSTRHGILILGEYIFYYLIVSPTEYYFMITPTQYNVMIMAGRHDNNSGKLSMTITSLTSFMASELKISGLEYVTRIYESFICSLACKNSYRYDEMLLAPFTEEEFKSIEYISKVPAEILVIDTSSY